MRSISLHQQRHTSHFALLLSTVKATFVPRAVLPTAEELGSVLMRRYMAEEQAICDKLNAGWPEDKRVLYDPTSVAERVSEELKRLPLR